MLPLKSNRECKAKRGFIESMYIVVHWGCKVSFLNVANSGSISEVTLKKANRLLPLKETPSKQKIRRNVQLL